MSMDERDLARLARDLGDRDAAAVRPERVAARVTARLRAGERLPRRFAHVGRWGLAVAALLTIAVTTDRLWRGPGSSDVADAVPVALSNLDDDGLTEALDSLVYTAPASEFVGWGVGTMTADELERLLSAMEG